MSINENMQEEKEHDVNPEANETADVAATEETEAPAENAGEEAAEEQHAEEANSLIAELQSKLEESQQRVLRVQADYDNFRRRTAKEKEELAQYASMKLLGQLLPVVDNFERAIAAAKGNPDFDSLSKGVDMIFRQLEGVLEQSGLKAMEAEGQPFNPEFHQAIMQVESEEHEEGTVVEEIQKGYMLGERVLRPAMVKVSG